MPLNVLKGILGKGVAKFLSRKFSLKKSPF